MQTKNKNSQKNPKKQYYRTNHKRKYNSRMHFI